MKKFFLYRSLLCLSFLCLLLAGTYVSPALANNEPPSFYPETVIRRDKTLQLSLKDTIQPSDTLSAPLDIGIYLEQPTADKNTLLGNTGVKQIVVYPRGNVSPATLAAWWKPQLISKGVSDKSADQFLSKLTTIAAFEPTTIALYSGQLDVMNTDGSKSVVKEPNLDKAILSTLFVR